MRTLVSALVLALPLAACYGQAPQPRLGHIHTSDVELATFAYGHAQADTTPIIVVNGGPGLSHVYLLQNDVWTRRMAEHRLVVFYDQRGTGASRPVNAGAPQTMEAQVADLDAVRVSLHADTVDLAGDSYGGLLAAAYVAAHPEHVHALILSDSAAPGFSKLHPRLDEVFPDVIARTKEESDKLKGQPNAQSRIDELELVAHFRMIFYSQELCDRYLAGARDLGLAQGVGDEVSKAIETLDLTPQMKQFHVPTLVIEGRYDLNVTPDVAWSVAHMIPGAQLVWFEKSGHLPYYEEPAKYTRVVEDFLAAQDSAARSGKH